MKQEIRKGAIMLQPAMGSITCRICNASYESETKLREHQSVSHRRGGNEERPQAAANAAQSESPET
jgi:hypothetical protein